MQVIARLVDRLLPAVLIALSVTVLAAGLLSYGAPQALGEGPATFVTPGIGARSSAETASPPTATPAAPGRARSGPPSSAPSGEAPPSPVSPSPAPVSPSPAPVSTAPPTRIVIASEGIDLPVISGEVRVPGQGPNGYPLCDVAQYLAFFEMPAQPGATYVYAHAREGMFLRLLEASLERDGERLLGALVEVYTDDNQLHLYEIYRVKRHATDFSLATRVPDGERRLVLQTSEGSRGTVPKLQVAARPLSTVAADPDEAHPRPKPRPCYDE